MGRVGKDGSTFIIDIPVKLNVFVEATIFRSKVA